MQIVEASDDDRRAAIDTLAKQLVAHFGAPEHRRRGRGGRGGIRVRRLALQSPARHVDRGASPHEDGEIREAFRTLRPKDGPKPLRAFAFLEVEGEDEPGGAGRSGGDGEAKEKRELGEPAASTYFKSPGGGTWNANVPSRSMAFCTRPEALASSTNSFT